jgi:AcrR family transcriptional regulator
LPRPKGTRDADYSLRRSELLRGMSRHMMRRVSPRPSLRELASAAGVSVPTLRHYFGARTQVVDAIFEECLNLGREGLEAQRQTEKPFELSILDYAYALIRALAADREVRLGDLFAVALGEGLLDIDLSRSTLRHIIDPTIDVLEARLRGHIARGEMIQTDVRAAALMLISPLLVASLHQDQLRGDTERPMSLPTMTDSIGAAFIRAFQAPSPPTEAAHPA